MEYPTCNSQNGEGETSKCFAIGLLRTKGLNKYYLMESNACSHYEVQFNDFYSLECVEELPKDNQ